MRRVGRMRRRSIRALTEIPLTPLIDTALTLLIIFMVTTPMLHNAIKVTLPKGKAQEDRNQSHELVVYVDKDSHVFVNGKKCTSAAIFDEIKKQMGTKHDKAVVVKADQAVSYGRVIELVDQIKVVGGVEYVVLATQKRV